MIWVVELGVWVAWKAAVHSTLSVYQVGRYLLYGKELSIEEARAQRIEDVLRRLEGIAEEGRAAPLTTTFRYEAAQA